LTYKEHEKSDEKRVAIRPEKVGRGGLALREIFSDGCGLLKVSISILPIQAIKVPEEDYRETHGHSK
jgi:hypothetical protein